MTTQLDDSARTIEIEIWSDVACPWCYIGRHRFLDALSDFEGSERVRVTWRAYQLSPETPAGERRSELDALVQSKGLPAEQVRQMFEHVSRTAAEEELRLDFDTVIAANTFDAHRLIHLAGDSRDAVVEALFRAHFREGAVIDDRAVLVDIASSTGLDPEVVRKQLDSDVGSDAVRADLDTARQLQVSAVPFFVADRRIAVSGAQPKDVFLQLLTQASATPVD
ncbi:MULTISPECIES: DsbA family oxidoreductase [unclassified Rhodococcus (in: high G+C Gram-positive bacteria)]|uniref:DsbA family oxidoreductase n=1 Tax=unclassified Rhodococcus (in: high G+C Gram-positive bacteria) TaxID=192944 RepID=UPI00131FEB8A|nr:MULTISPECIES: DsbA family oxidoreductase [unclassified Rhodococcus (in: high G+C Gram-positive bacteria)]QHE67288.1 2-hydroxychromene-2-carboxylate isomerase/DsbA-like thioredoxin domain [Rhodococcus sp. WAY2]